MALEKDEISDVAKKVSRKLQGKKQKRILISIIIILIAALVCALIIMSKSLAKKNKKIEELSDKTYVAENMAEEININVLAAEIKEIGELATVEYLYTDAAAYSNSKQINDWNIPFTTKSLLVKWNGVIKAGVKTEKIRIDDSVKGMLSVEIPEAQILSHSPDFDSFEYLNEKDGLFNKITFEDANSVIAESQEKMEERAIEAGLLNAATENAKKLIQNFLESDSRLKQYDEIKISVAGG